MLCYSTSSERVSQRRTSEISAATSFETRSARNTEERIQLDRCLDVAADASTLGDGVARAGEYCCLFIVTDARVPGVHVKMCLPKCPGFCSAASSGDFFSISWMYDPCALPTRVAAAELRSCAFNTVRSKSGWGTQAKMGRCVLTVAASLSSQHLPRS